MENRYNCIETDEFLIGFPMDIISYCNAHMELAREQDLDEIYDDLKFIKDFIKYLNYQDNQLIRISKTPMGEFKFHVVNYLDEDEMEELEEDE